MSSCIEQPRASPPLSPENQYAPDFAKSGGASRPPKPKCMINIYCNTYIARLHTTTQLLDAIACISDARPCGLGCVQDARIDYALYIPTSIHLFLNI